VTEERRDSLSASIRLSISSMSFWLASSSDLRDDSPGDAPAAAVAHTGVALSEAGISSPPAGRHFISDANAKLRTVGCVRTGEGASMPPPPPPPTGVEVVSSWGASQCVVGDSGVRP